MTSTSGLPSHPDRPVSSTSPMTRLVVALVLGLAAGAVTATFKAAHFAPIIGWTVTAFAYTAWTWLDIWRMTPEETAEHATREEPGRRVTHLLVLAAALASLVGVAFLLLASGHSHRYQLVAACIAIVSVVASWFALHSLFGLRYARFYYTGVDGGINFNQKEPPRYTDFMYVAFTVGMSFAISDTNVEDSDLRSTVLGHAILSYLFGSVIIASVVNLVAGL